MSDGLIALVRGMGEVASAVARQLLLAGYAVVMHQPIAPAHLRRLMNFSDAWFDGQASLEGVEARRAITAHQLVTGLRSRSFIPVLTEPFHEVVGRWPWDVLVDARLEGGAGETLRDLADLSIGLGAGFIAGESADLVIDVEGRDPGAILRQGSVGPAVPACPAGEVLTLWAPRPGVFHGAAILGRRIDEGELFGWIADVPLRVPGDCPEHALLRGLLRDGTAVAAGRPLAEIVRQGMPVGGIGAAARQIARAVVLAADMEMAGCAPVAWPSLERR